MSFNDSSHDSHGRLEMRYLSVLKQFYSSLCVPVPVTIAFTFVGHRGGKKAKENIVAQGHREEQDCCRNNNSRVSWNAHALALPEKPKALVERKIRLAFNKKAHHIAQKRKQI